MSETGQPSPRERLVATALEEIRRDGMTVGLEHLGLERVIRRSGVSRATAYRQWPTKAAFLAEVLVRAVHETDLEPEGFEEVERIKALLLPDPAEVLGTERSRRDLVVEGLRISVQADVERIVASPRWRTYLAIGATCRGLPEGPLREEVTEALARAEERFTAHRAEVYARMPRLIGYRLAPPLEGEAGYRAMAVALGATMTGLVVHAYARPALVTDTFRAAAFGASRAAEWTLPAYHLVGVVLGYLVPDPEVRWSDARVAATLRLVHDLEQLLARTRGRG